ITLAKEEVGNVITQSVIALGVANCLVEAVDKDLLKEVMLSKVPAKVHEINKQAYDIGYREAMKNK
ncbi:MAG: 2-oxoglutarate:acceptor oxidoreductase, partial [Campylobacterota bacterium]|nr:2-oxoglutarate:acceptor oxidoreductase [Campylobacterota bacterium]